jgi:hypothetical protein
MCSIISKYCRHLVRDASLGRKYAPSPVAFRMECIRWVKNLSTERCNPKGLPRFQTLAELKTPQNNRIHITTPNSM